MTRLGRYFIPDQPLHIIQRATTVSRSSFAMTILPNIESG